MPERPTEDVHGAAGRHSWPGIGAGLDSGSVTLPLRRMWHVTLTVAGEPHDPDDVREGLERLAEERPFMLSGRFAAERAEIRYWEEGPDVDGVAALALRVWGEHRGTAGLPRWNVTGLEVVDEDTYRARALSRDGEPALVPAGGVRPF